MSTLSEIFDKDPLSLTKQDLNQIIEAHRAARQQFQLAGDKTAGATKKIAPKKGEGPALDLKELGLD